MEKLITYFLLKKNTRLEKFKFNDAGSVKMNDYEEFIPTLKQICESKLYWHGTGRYHYEYNLISREQSSDPENIIDVLALIFDRNSLVAHEDLFVTFDSKLQKTVSLTPFRMYARCYAEIHQYEADNLIYEYGDIAFWMSIITPLQIIAILGNRPVRNYFLNFIKILRSGNTLKKTRGWISSFQSKKTNISLFHLDKLRSDIPNNYGIILAFKQDTITAIAFDKAIERFETRVKGDLSLCSLSHVEVPLKNFAETKEFLVARNITIPVVPIEYMERCCNRYTLKDLI